jgi:colanic acid biosynthesis glycosyl transferase WcaI
MHLHILTQYYPPEVGAPQTRLHELAVGLIQQGIEVTILTAMPSYPQGRVHDGYKGVLHTEILDGVKVIRIAIFLIIENLSKVFLELCL